MRKMIVVYFAANIELGSFVQMLLQRQISRFSTDVPVKRKSCRSMRISGLDRISVSIKFNRESERERNLALSDIRANWTPSPQYPNL